MEPISEVQKYIDQGICPITGDKPLETTIKVRQWNIFLIAFNSRAGDVPVSFEGKEMQKKAIGTFWEIFDKFGGFFLWIPFLGGLLLLFLFLFLAYTFYIWIIVDLIRGKTIFGRGILRISSKGDLSLVRN